MWFCLRRGQQSGVDVTAPHAWQAMSEAVKEGTRAATLPFSITDASVCRDVVTSEGVREQTKTLKGKRGHLQHPAREPHAGYERPKALQGPHESHVVRGIANQEAERERAWDTMHEMDVGLGNRTPRGSSLLCDAFGSLSSPNRCVTAESKGRKKKWALGVGACPTTTLQQPPIFHKQNPFS